MTGLAFKNFDDSHCFRCGGVGAKSIGKPAMELCERCYWAIRVSGDVQMAATVFPIRRRARSGRAARSIATPLRPTESHLDNLT